MAHLPDVERDSDAADLRDAINIGAAIAGFFAGWQFYIGNIGFGLLAAVVSGAAFFGASKIKVYYRLRGGVAVYQ